MFKVFSFLLLILCLLIGPVLAANHLIWDKDMLCKCTNNICGCASKDDVVRCICKVDVNTKSSVCLCVLDNLRVMECYCDKEKKCLCYLVVP